MKIFWIAYTALLFLHFVHVEAAASSDPFGGASSKPYSTKPQLELPPRKETPPQPTKLPPKVELPLMLRPFEMPGVIGLKNNKWQGTDYLGYLSNNIGIDVELVKGSSIPQLPDRVMIERRIAEIFSKEDINPKSEASEGPPLPFLHIMLIVYQVDKDRYAIFGNGRLFEQIEVVRKDFIPAGYWQGITWENQDITLASGENLHEKIIEMADKLATAFAKRYRQYNFNREGLPGGERAPALSPDSF